jgi:hypothetical protein
MRLEVKKQSIAQSLRSCCGTETKPTTKRIKRSNIEKHPSQKRGHRKKAIDFPEVD